MRETPSRRNPCSCEAYTGREENATPPPTVPCSFLEVPVCPFLEEMSPTFLNKSVLRSLGLETGALRAPASAALCPFKSLPRGPAGPSLLVLLVGSWTSGTEPLIFLPFRLLFPNLSAVEFCLVGKGIAFNSIKRAEVSSFPCLHRFGFCKVLFSLFLPLQHSGLFHRFIPCIPIPLTLITFFFFSLCKCSLPEFPGFLSKPFICPV